jgi:hypothetical protein
MAEVDQMFGEGEINVAERSELKNYIFTKSKYEPITKDMEERITWKNLVFNSGIIQ